MDGIKYEQIGGTGPEAEWEMLLFKNEELINYLTALQVNHSVYEYVVYESEVEREFAKQLDQREDIKLFVKLPGLVRDRHAGRQIQSRLGDRQARRPGPVPGPRNQEYKGLPEASHQRGRQGPLRAEAF